jgi:hypothetical protein
MRYGFVFLDSRLPGIVENPFNDLRARGNNDLIQTIDRRTQNLNFSRSIQSSFSAASIAKVSSGEDSLYKYRKRSSGVKSVIGKTI